MERQNFFDGLPHLIIQSKPDSGLSFLLATLQLQPQFDKEQFFKDDADVGRRAKCHEVSYAFAFVRPMNSLEGLPRRQQIKTLAYRRRNCFRQFGRKIFECSVDYAPEPSRR